MPATQIRRPRRRNHERQSHHPDHLERFGRARQLVCAFAGAHRDVAAQVALGSILWLALFTALVAITTIKRVRSAR